MKIKGLLLAGAALTSFSTLATTYPLHITDLDNQPVTIKHEPQHVILQDGRDIFALALLDRENPFRRVVAWNNLPKKQDVQSWQMLNKAWPQAAKILDMGFNDHGEVNLESVIAQKPDLMIAQLRAKAALKETGVIDSLNRLGIPVVFIDYEIDPAKNTAPSVTLLGKILNQEQRAQQYTDFWHQRAEMITQRVSKQPAKARVFIEPIAGNTENCCFTHGHNGWGKLVEAAGGENIGSGLLPGGSGFVSLEKIIAMKPDVYIMSGSKRPNAAVLPFGYGVTPAEVKPAFDKLIARNGLQQIAPVKAGRVYGVYHHFYNHPYNIIGMEILAKDIYPAAFSDIDPTADYHTIIKDFTQLPDQPITLSYSLSK